MTWQKHESEALAAFIEGRYTESIRSYQNAIAEIE
jgi:hypothetical protein